MPEEVVVSRLPSCDICNERGIDRPAKFDAKMQEGPWANLCEDHFAMHGRGLGTGKGQRLILREERVSSSARPSGRQAGIVVPSMEDVEEAINEGGWHPECPYCGGSGYAEFDADFSACTSCDKQFKIARCDSVL